MVGATERILSDRSYAEIQQLTRGRKRKSGDFFSTPGAIAQLSQTRAGASLPGIVEAPANRADCDLISARPNTTY
jgi:hypothetical protein